MPSDNGNGVSFLIPRCLRRKKTPPTSETARNVFEQRMKRRLKKQTKRSSRANHARPRPVHDAFATLDLIDARDRSVVTKIKKAHWLQVLNWDSIADTYVSPVSSVGAEAGGIIGTTHTQTPHEGDPETLGRYTALVTRKVVSQEAAFRLEQLASLDMTNCIPSFVYEVPRESTRKWSVATTEGSVGDYCLLHSLN